MTKMKSKKMTKSTFAIIIMAIAMVAMLAFGGTYAYFTATATDVTTGDVTTGTIHLTSNNNTSSLTVNVDRAVTGHTILGAVSYNLTDTTVDTWVVVKMDITVTTPASANEDQTKKTEFMKKLFTDFAPEAGWNAVSGQEFTYAQKVTATKSEDTVTLSKTDLQFLKALTITANPNWTQVGSKPDEMGAAFEITISARAVQAFGLASDDATGAYNATFGNSNYPKQESRG